MLRTAAVRIEQDSMLKSMAPPEEFARMTDRQAVTSLAHVMIRDGAYKREVLDPATLDENHPDFRYLFERGRVRFTYTVAIGEPLDAKETDDFALANQMIGVRAAIDILTNTDVPPWARGTPGDVKDGCVDILKAIDGAAVQRTLPPTDRQ